MIIKQSCHIGHKYIKWDGRGLKNSTSGGNQNILLTFRSSELFRLSLVPFLMCSNQFCTQDGVVVTSLRTSSPQSVQKNLSGLGDCSYQLGLITPGIVPGMRLSSPNAECLPFWSNVCFLKGHNAFNRHNSTSVASCLDSI